MDKMAEQLCHLLEELGDNPKVLQPKTRTTTKRDGFGAVQSVAIDFSLRFRKPDETTQAALRKHGFLGPE